jgi:methanogenic corrinoid protein MtbC1
MTEQTYRDYLQNLLYGNRASCLEQVKQLLDEGIEIKILYTELFQRSLYTVGELWEQNKISVATEHLATSITESAMGLVQPLLFSNQRTGHKAVVSCVANEFHQIGGKMVADIFELHGWDGYFLGANTPLPDLLEMLKEKKPDVACFSLSIYSNLPVLLTAIEAVRNNFPAIDILVGGQAFRWGGKEVIQAAPRVTLLESLDDLEQYLERPTSP